MKLFGLMIILMGISISLSRGRKLRKGKYEWVLIYYDDYENKLLSKLTSKYNAREFIVKWMRRHPKGYIRTPEELTDLKNSEKYELSRIQI